MSTGGVLIFKANRAVSCGCGQEKICCYGYTKFSPQGTIMQLSVCQVIPVGELLAVMPP